MCKQNLGEIEKIQNLLSWKINHLSFCLLAGKKTIKILNQMGPMDKNKIMYVIVQPSVKGIA